MPKEGPTINGSLAPSGAREIGDAIGRYLGGCAKAFGWGFCATAGALLAARMFW